MKHISTVRYKSIKDTYRKELKKVKDSKKSGTDPDSLYVPRLYWYGKADSFLREIVSTRRSTSNMVSFYSFTEKIRNTMKIRICSLLCIYSVSLKKKKGIP